MLVAGIRHTHLDSGSKHAGMTRVRTSEDEGRWDVIPALFDGCFASWVEGKAFVKTSIRIPVSMDDDDS